MYKLMKVLFMLSSAGGILAACSNDPVQVEDIPVVEVGAPAVVEAEAPAVADDATNEFPRTLGYTQ